MRLGIRAILLIVAIILFLLSLVLDKNRMDMLAVGLAFLAGGLLVDDLNLGSRGGIAGRDRL